VRTYHNYIAGAWTPSVSGRTFENRNPANHDEIIGLLARDPHFGGIHESAFFKYVADRYGRVGPGGVELSIPLTHDLISQLVGAHRPSVSTALGRLEHAGDVSRDGHCWTLHGTAPALEHH